MKTGRTLQDLAGEVLRQKASRRDFVADTRRMKFAVGGENGNTPTLLLEDGNFGLAFHLTEMCHEQLAEKLQIPRKYYERMMSKDPELLAHNVNTWFQKEPGQQMVRTLDGKARAFLSDKFRPLDNHELLEAILPSIGGHKWDIKSCELTDKRLYLKAVSQDIRAEIAQDHVNVVTHGRTHIIHPGFTISNSEIGHGAIRIEPTCHWEHCLNLCTLDGAGLRKYHMGRAGAGADLDNAVEYFRDETRQADDKALWMKVKDVVDAAISEDSFLKMVDTFNRAKEMKIDRDPVKVVEEVGKKYLLTKDESSSVLLHLVRDGDLSAYGLSAAITRASQDVPSYDRATELERIGGRVVELPQTDWANLAVK